MVEVVGHHVAVLEVQVQGARWVVAVGGGVRGAESRPLTAIVECYHCHMTGDWGRGGGGCAQELNNITYIVHQHCTVYMEFDRYIHACVYYLYILYGI